jgi:hypothetical protein
VLAGKLSKGIACCKQADECFRRSQDIIKGGFSTDNALGYTILGFAVGFALGAIVVQVYTRR